MRSTARSRAPSCSSSGFWLTNIALLFGAEINAEIEREKEWDDGGPQPVVTLAAPREGRHSGLLRPVQCWHSSQNHHVGTDFEIEPFMLTPQEGRNGASLDFSVARPRIWVRMGRAR